MRSRRLRVALLDSLCARRAFLVVAGRKKRRSAEQRNGGLTNSSLARDQSSRARGRNLHEREDGVIGRSRMRDTPLLATAVNAASLFGTRVANANSAASIRALKPHIWTQAIRITLSTALASRGPSTYARTPSAARETKQSRQSLRPRVAPGAGHGRDS